MADFQFAYKNNATRFRKIVGGQVGADAAPLTGEIYTIFTIPKGVMVLGLYAYVKGVGDADVISATVRFDDGALPDVPLTLRKATGVESTTVANIITQDELRCGIELSTELPIGADVYVGVEYIDLEVSSEQRVRSKEGDVTLPPVTTPPISG